MLGLGLSAVSGPWGGARASGGPPALGGACVWSSRSCSGQRPAPLQAPPPRPPSTRTGLIHSSPATSYAKSTSCAKPNGRTGFHAGGVLLENTSESYFLQAQHRFAPGCSAFARYDAFFARVDDDHDGSTPHG